MEPAAAMDETEFSPAVSRVNVEGPGHASTRCHLDHAREQHRAGLRLPELGWRRWYVVLSQRAPYAPETSSGPSSTFVSPIPVEVKRGLPLSAHSPGSLCAANDA